MPVSKLFFRIYGYFYCIVLKIIYPSNIFFRSFIKSDGFFTIEISKNSKLFIGKNVFCKKGVLIASRENSKILINDNVFINRNSSIISRKKIILGKGVLLGENVKIYDHNHAIVGNRVKRRDFTTYMIKIGRECWIGNDSNILKNAYIKPYSIIGAMSLVNKPLVESGIYFGIPIKRYQK
jgi:acetyltransferase-like isoleucine patch superfamily enzyme